MSNLLIEVSNTEDQWRLSASRSCSSKERERCQCVFLAMEQDDFFSQQKVETISRVGAEYALNRCDGEDREVCLEVRQAMRGFADVAISLRAQFQRCAAKQGEEGAQTEESMVAMRQCMKGYEETFRNAIDGTYATLEKLGLAP